MRFHKSAVAVAAALCLTLTGCAISSGSGGSDQSTDRSGQQSGGKKVPLRFQSLAFQPATVKASKAIVDSWNADHPDIPVKYVQGSWDSVQDKLVTQFQGETAPDIIHYQSAATTQFAEQGYLADLGPYLSSDVKKAVSKDIWDTVTVDKKVIAAPTLLQSYVVFANKDLLKEAGVPMPTGDTWSWKDFMAAAKMTTRKGVHGVGWGLGQPTATALSLGLNFGGTYFSGSGASAQIDVGDKELALPERIHRMTYQDKSLDPVTLTQSGSDVMTGFLKGKYAMTVQGSYAAQTLAESAPANLHWVAMPLLAADTAHQAADPQTLSVSAQSKNVKGAAEFVNYFMRTQNLAKVAEGDWLIPTSSTAVAQVRKDTNGQNGWATILAGGKYLTKAPFQSATNYPQWKDQIATPAFQQYLANKISARQLSRQLTDGWQQVNQ